MGLPHFKAVFGSFKLHAGATPTPNREQVVSSSRWRRCAATAAAIICLANTAQANRYTLIDLGPVVWDAHINDSGFVTGSSYGVYYYGRARLWTGDHWHRLEQGGSRGYGINSHGDVVGIIDPLVGGIPVLWRFNKPVLRLPLPCCAAVGSPNGVNDAQEVVGSFRPDTLGRCFKWTEMTGSVDLGTMGDGLYCRATAINNKGQITGTATTEGAYKSHAFRYEAGRFQDLGSLSTDQYAIAEGDAINNQGDIVGFSQTSRHDHAVLWRGMQMIDLQSDSGYPGHTYALGINDRGDIVGFGRDSWGERTAVRFTNPGVVTLDSEVIDLGRWHLIEATSVNQHGDIAAHAIGPDGFDKVVILRFEAVD